MPTYMDLPVWEDTRISGQTRHRHWRKEKLNVPVATEEELLEFANSLREAGGGEALAALMPSAPTDPRSCLIATSLNFNCQVDALGGHWYMATERDNFDDDQVRAISGLMGNQAVHECSSDGEWLFWWLPDHIANAADAFDRGVAFQNYRRGNS